MSRLADDLLVLARADQGRLPLDPQPLAATELLERGRLAARAAADVRGRSIVIDGVQTAPRCWPTRTGRRRRSAT